MRRQNNISPVRHYQKVRVLAAIYEDVALAGGIVTRNVLKNEAGTN